MIATSLIKKSADEVIEKALSGVVKLIYRAAQSNGTAYLSNFFVVLYDRQLYDTIPNPSLDGFVEFAGKLGYNVTDTLTEEERYYAYWLLYTHALLWYDNANCDSMSFEDTLDDEPIYDVGFLLLNVGAAYALEPSVIDFLKSHLEEYDGLLLLAWMAAIVIKRSNELSGLLLEDYTQRWQDLFYTIAMRFFAVGENITYEEALQELNGLLASAVESMQGFDTRLAAIKQQIEAIQRGEEGYIAALVHTAATLYDGINTYTPDKFAPEEHNHDDVYLLTTEVARDAHALVDDAGNRYYPEDFADKDHTHDEYALKDEITDADFLTDGSNLYRLEDFALSIHMHPEYASPTEPVRNALAFTDGAYAFGDPDITNVTYELAKISHSHDWDKAVDELPSWPTPPYRDDGYIALLRRDEPAVAAYRLNGKAPSEFALKNHAHNYVTISEANEIAVRVTDPVPAEPNVKGVKTWLDKPGTAQDLKATVHYIIGTLTLAGGPETVEVDNVIFAHATLIGGSAKAALPYIHYITKVDENGNVHIKGVKFVPATDEVTPISYIIAYLPKNPPPPKEG